MRGAASRCAAAICRNCGTSHSGPHVEEYHRNMPSREGWSQVWASMPDEELTAALRDYLWLAAQLPGFRADRRDQIIEEANRRRKPQIIEKALKARLPIRTRKGRTPVL